MGKCSKIAAVTAFVSSPRFVEHVTGPHHPERPDRIRAIYRALFDAGLLESDPFPDFRLDTGLKPLGLPRLRCADFAPADESQLKLVHTPGHIERIKRVCARGGGLLDQGDTPVGANGHEIALLSLGAALSACDLVMTGQARRAFVAARPPGHHAEPDRAMGFCLYSNMAIAARCVQQRYGVQRVAIVDFDVHHGNGTQACLDADPSILFISLHQHPSTCYPGTGHEWEIGVGPGLEYTLNIPLEPGSGDTEYLRAVETRVIPRLDTFRPQVLMLSAGFDAHADDPLAQMQVSEAGFERLTRLLVNAAERHAQGRVISLLEGGYNLRALGRSVVRHVKAMHEPST